MTPTNIALILVLCIVGSKAIQLPDYIKPCSASDPKLTECATKAANAALKHLAKGDPKYHAQSLLPLHVPEIIVRNNQLTVKLVNVKMSGLEDMDIKKLKIDIAGEKIVVNMDFHLPRVNLIAEYEVEGRILILPISGNGPANLTLVRNDVHLFTEFLLTEKKGKHFGSIVESKLDYTTGRAYFNFENLFNGDKRLGDQMNLLLNENWSDVLNELKEGIAETLKAIVNAGVTGFTDRVSFEEMFLP